MRESFRWPHAGIETLKGVRCPCVGKPVLESGPAVPRSGGEDRLKRRGEDGFGVATRNCGEEIELVGGFGVVVPSATTLRDSRIALFVLT